MEHGRKADLYTGVSLLVVSALVFLDTFRYPPADVTEVASTATFPRLAAGGLAVLAVFLVVGALRGRRGPEVPPLSRDEGRRLLIACGLLVFYLVVCPVLGFPIVTTLTTAGLMYLVGERRYLRIGIVSVVFTVSIYLIFVSGLGVPLPSGFWNS